VLICLYQDSQMVLRDIASRVGITERAVQRIIQDLEDAGYVQRERVGRCNHYHVIHNKHLRHPIEDHCTVDMLFDVILENS
jgi:predicted ArsR family transcriptional regulator